MGCQEYFIRILFCGMTIIGKGQGVYPVHDDEK